MSTKMREHKKGEAFGMSIHPLRQKLIAYSKLYSSDTTLKTYYIKYFEGPKYHNINLRKYEIKATNYIEAYVVMYDFLNMKLKVAGQMPSDQYEILMDILVNDEDLIDDEGNFIDMDMLDLHNDTLWLEEDDNKITTLMFVN